MRNQLHVDAERGKACRARAEEHPRLLAPRLDRHRLDAVVVVVLVFVQDVHLPAVQAHEQLPGDAGRRIAHGAGEGAVAETVAPAT